MNLHKHMGHDKKYEMIAVHVLRETLGQKWPWHHKRDTTSFFFCKKTHWIDTEIKVLRATVCTHKSVIRSFGVTNIWSNGRKPHRSDTSRKFAKSCILDAILEKCFAQSASSRNYVVSQTEHTFGFRNRIHV